MTFALDLSRFAVKKTGMSTATLTIDLTALRANWRALKAMSQAETGAVIKADGYGLGSAPVARALLKEGVKTFFVAAAEEGIAVRDAVGSGPVIYVFSGHMEGDSPLLQDHDLTPLLNSVDQLIRHAETIPDHPFGVQLDTGMNRLGMEAVEWFAVKDLVLGLGPKLIMSHLACADDPDHPMNRQQLLEFKRLTEGLNVPRSLAATGGILLGSEYHFDLTRPGIGIYGGRPFVKARSVVTVDVPVIQIREIDKGETVGYSNTWTAPTPRRIATIAAGYADGIIRAMGPKIRAYAGDVGCPVVGRISMDMIGVDITLLDHTPKRLSLLTRQQGVDTVATAAGTIGYEILTSLGARYKRRYIE